MTKCSNSSQYQSRYNNNMERRDGHIAPPQADNCSEKDSKHQFILVVWSLAGWQWHIGWPHRHKYTGSANNSMSYYKQRTST